MPATATFDKFPRLHPVASFRSRAWPAPTESGRRCGAFIGDACCARRSANPIRGCLAQVRIWCECPLVVLIPVRAGHGPVLTMLFPANNQAVFGCWHAACYDQIGGGRELFPSSS